MSRPACPCCGHSKSRYNKDIVCNSCRGGLREREFVAIRAFLKRELCPDMMEERPYLEGVKKYLRDWLPRLNMGCEFIPYRRHDLAEMLPAPASAIQDALEELCCEGYCADELGSDSKRVGIRILEDAA